MTGTRNLFPGTLVRTELRALRTELRALTHAPAGTSAAPGQSLKAPADLFAPVKSSLVQLTPPPLPPSAAPGNKPSQLPAFRGSSPFPTGKASAEGAGTVKAGKDAPFVSQYSPDGSSKLYSGVMNCGPAAMASVARACGMAGGLTDSQLVSTLNLWAGTNTSTSDFEGIPQAGTTTDQMKTLADKLHLPHTEASQPTTGWIDSQLAAGNKVMTLGNFYAEASHAKDGETEGHYIVVSSKNADGTYNVMDPASASQTKMTSDELSAFISTQAKGGWAMSLGTPTEETKFPSLRPPRSASGAGKSANIKGDGGGGSISTNTTTTTGGADGGKGDNGGGSISTNTTTTTGGGGHKSNVAG